GAQDLERDLALELTVVGQVHDDHAASPDLALDDEAVAEGGGESGRLGQATKWEWPGVCASGGRMSRCCARSPIVERRAYARPARGSSPWHCATGYSAGAGVREPHTPGMDNGTAENCC